MAASAQPFQTPMPGLITVAGRLSWATTVPAEHTGLKLAVCGHPVTDIAVSHQQRRLTPATAGDVDDDLSVPPH